LGDVVKIPTPVGNQEGHVVASDDNSCNWIRYGLKEGENVEDSFELHQYGDSLIYSMLHTSPEGNTIRVRRVSSKVFGG